MSKAINSNDVMNQDEINELINEFNKDKILWVKFLI